MAVDPVPWLVENGASHSANVARNVTYAAFGGNPGIITGPALEVRELAAPGASIRVFPGTCAIENNAAGIRDEMYVARVASETILNIAATGGSARTDMIVAQVENPWLAGEPWVDPPSNANGPYFFLRVLSNVPSTAKTLADAGYSGSSAIPLARINVPASTATITQAMITDLRSLAQPRVKEVVVQQSGISPTVNLESVAADGTYVTFGGSWSVDIPKWAGTAILTGWIEAVATDGGKGSGAFVRVNLVNVGTTQTTVVDRNNEAFAPGNWFRAPINAGGVVAVPTAARGTTKTVKFEASNWIGIDAGHRSLFIDQYTTSLLRIRFEESPTSNL